MARKTRIDQIAAIDLEMEQLENRKKELLAAQKAENEKARTHRLCKRHGLFESMLPDAITLTEDNFKVLLQKTVANDFGRKMLANLLAEQKQATAGNTDNAPSPVTITESATVVNPSQNAENPSVSTPQNAVKTAS
jgi:L-lactate utilization protein LutC